MTAAVDHRHDDDDKSPTSPDTGCWSSSDVSRSPSSCNVEPRRQRFQPVGRSAGDDADICLLKLPPPDELHIPDIRFSEFYRRSHQHHHHQQQQSLSIPAVTYSTPPPPPRYPPGYGAVMPLRCDRGGYTTTAAAEYGAPGGGVCYNGVGVNLCDNRSSSTDMLLRQDTVRLRLLSSRQCTF